MQRFSLTTAFILLTSTLNAQGTAVVSGVVRDEAGGPIREALVVIDPDSLSLRARAGVDGRYRIPAVPNGRFEVRIVRIGFRPQSQTIEVTGREFEFNVTMVSVPIPLDTVAVRVARPGLYGLVVTRGINILPHEPRPLAGATIEVINEPYRARSGPDGRFSIPQLGIGSHAIMVTLERFAPRIVPVTVPPEGGVDITFTVDSIFARYQTFDADRVRAIAFRQRAARSPATFVSGHELDVNAPTLLEALKYAHSALSRGIIFQNAPVCIYVDNLPQGRLQLTDLRPEDIEGIEVYPESSLSATQAISPGNGTGQMGVPCHSSAGDNPSPQGPGRAFERPSQSRNPANKVILILIWTTKRR